jgi:GGDEF domain-containing protein
MSAVIEPVPWTAPPGAAPPHAGLGSRAELLATLAAAIPAVDPSRGLLLLALDVDDFRRFNAERGYAAGDLLLADLGGRLARVGRAFALGADAFALVLDGSPEELWRRGLAALWSLDPGAGALALRCSFGAAVLVDPQADAVAALVLAEDRLADQRNRAPSVTERYGELVLAILRAQQPETSEHALDVAEVAAGVAARLGGETLGFDAVVVNLYRKAWDDFIVSTVHGDESMRAALLGATYSWEDWESMLFRALPPRRGVPRLRRRDRLGAAVGQADRRRYRDDRRP